MLSEKHNFWKHANAQSTNVCSRWTLGYPVTICSNSRLQGTPRLVGGDVFPIADKSEMNIFLTADLQLSTMWQGHITSKFPLSRNFPLRERLFLYQLIRGIHAVLLVLGNGNHIYHAIFTTGILLQFSTTRFVAQPCPQTCKRSYRIFKLCTYLLGARVGLGGCLPNLPASTVTILMMVALPPPYLLLILYLCQTAANKQWTKKAEGSL